jgi:hypothetical protein
MSLLTCAMIGFVNARPLLAGHGSPANGAIVILTSVGLLYALVALAALTAPSARSRGGREDVPSPPGSAARPR